MDLLAAMRVYVRVVERGSMSSAARDLSLGQPAVSERMEHLEQHLGVQLLRRNPRALACTHDGRAFYVQSKKVLETVEAAYAAVTPDRHVLRGQLRLAAPQCLGEVVLPRVLGRVRAQHPQLGIDLVLNDRVVDPVTEGVDISLRLGPPGEGDFILHRLGHVRRQLVAAPAYIERQGDIREPQDLIRHPFIHVAGLFGDGHLPLQLDQRHDIRTPITPVVKTSHWRPMYELLLAGGGIGVVQHPACVDALLEGSLVRLLPRYTVRSFEFSALVAATHPIPLRTRAVLSILKEQLPGLVDGPPGCVDLGTSSCA